MGGGGGGNAAVFSNLWVEESGCVLAPTMVGRIVAVTLVNTGTRVSGCVALISRLPPSGSLLADKTNQDTCPHCAGFQVFSRRPAVFL